MENLFKSKIIIKSSEFIKSSKVGVGMYYMHGSENFKSLMFVDITHSVTKIP